MRRVLIWLLSGVAGFLVGAGIAQVIDEQEPTNLDRGVVIEEDLR